MKKELLSEVKRINEIMGTSFSKNLLTETNIVDDILTRVTKIFDAGQRIVRNDFPNLIEFRFGKQAMTIEAREWELLQKFVRNQIPIEQLSPKALRFLGRLLATDQKFVDQLYRQQMVRFMEKTGAEEIDALKALKKEADDNHGGDLYSAMLKTFDDPEEPNSSVSEVLSSLLYNKVNMRMSKVSNNTFQPEVFRPKGTVSDVVSIYKSGALSTYLTLMKNWLTQWGKQGAKKREAEINELVVRIKQRLEKLGEAGESSKEAVDIEMDAIFNLVLAKKQKMLSQLRDDLDKYIFNNADIPEEIRKNFKEIPYVKQVYDDTIKSASATLKNQIFTAIDANLKSVPGIGQLYAPLSFGIKYVFLGEKYKGTLKDEFIDSFRRLGTKILYRSPYTPTELLSRTVAAGKTATLVEKAIAFAAVDGYLIPAVVEYVRGFIINSQIQELKKKVEVIKKLCKMGVFENCPETLEKLSNYTEAEFRQRLWDNVPIVKIFRGNFDWGSDILFFTYVDDIITSAWDVVDNFVFGDQDILDTWMKQAGEARNRLRDEVYDKYGYDISSDDFLEKASALLDKKYPNTRSGFIQSFRDLGSKEPDSEFIDLGNGQYEFGGLKYRFNQTDNENNVGDFEVIEE